MRNYLALRACFLSMPKKLRRGIFISYLLPQSRGKHALAATKPGGSPLRAPLRLENVVNTLFINEKFNQKQKTSQRSTSMNVRKIESPCPILNRRTISPRENATLKFANGLINGMCWWHLRLSSWRRLPSPPLRVLPFTCCAKADFKLIKTRVDKIK